MLPLKKGVEHKGELYFPRCENGNLYLPIFLPDGQPIEFEISGKVIKELIDYHSSFDSFMNSINKEIEDSMQDI